MQLTIKNKDLNTLYRVLDKIKVTNMRANRGRAKLLAKVVDKIKEYAKDEGDLIDLYAQKTKMASLSLMSTKHQASRPR